MKNNQVILCSRTVPEICEANRITNTTHWIHPDRNTSISPVVKAKQNTELQKLFLQLVELNNTTSAQSNEGLITMISNAIKATAFEKYDLAELARQLGLSYEYLSRVFSRATGMTISHDKNHVKIQKAIDLLHLGSMNISEIAQHQDILPEESSTPSKRPTDSV